ncbi:HK97-gp10 family putative phage morphogenesis protein [Tuberibacillus calidus]|jgi:HK97 gp10 family phage protein|uniref:HK97-gp10 family putative phage morphogenesis protein n=1 Tax=Tuberibacillus calidus TaxID=340097 RepID=UPI00040E7D8B|nr:HK97-gp10 family putative phage morphogenesis protein [Tuberibacillus calidus]
MGKKFVDIDFANRGRELAEGFTNDSIKLESAIEKNLFVAAKAVENDAKRLSPVDTGQLRASIATRQNGHGENVAFQVGSQVEYAKFVEYGTRKMRAQPFLRPSLQKNKAFIKDQIVKALKESFK